MRTILNLSLPPKAAQAVKKRAKMRGFLNTSSYVRHLIESDEGDVISEQELLELSKQADKDYKAGKLIKAKSLADLI